MAETTAARTVTLTNPQGLHFRPAELFVKLAGRFESKIEVVKNSLRVDGKSMMDMLLLVAEGGTQLTIVANGRDADAAVNALAEMVLQDFKEPETKE